jgi:hypothetical protein
MGEWKAATLDSDEAAHMQTIWSREEHGILLDDSMTERRLILETIGPECTDIGGFELRHGAAN